MRDEKHIKYSVMMDAMPRPVMCDTSSEVMQRVKKRKDNNEVVVPRKPDSRLVQELNGPNMEVAGLSAPMRWGRMDSNEDSGVVSSALGNKLSVDADPFSWES